MEEQQEVLIRCEQISKKYRGRTVLEDVSFEIRRGEFLSLLGPSGSGKTTILRLLIGIEQPTSGRILKEGPEHRHRLSELFAFSQYGCISQHRLCPSEQKNG